MRKAIITVVFFLGVSVFALAQDAPQAPAADCNAKVAAFFAASGFKPVPTKQCGVYFIADALPDLPHTGLQGMILIAEDDQSDMLMIGTVVQPKAEVDLSQASLLNLVQLNNDIDYAKLGIDADGDLFVRAEMQLKPVDEAGFKLALERVITATNKVYSSVRK